MFNTIHIDIPTKFPKVLEGQRRVQKFPGKCIMHMYVVNKEISTKTPEILGEGKLYKFGTIWIIFHLIPVDQIML